MITGASQISAIPKPNANQTGILGKAEATEKKSAKQIGELTEEEKAHVQELKKIDQEVRAHEEAHQAAGGQYTGAASYSYTVGPDGNRYAIAGEVPIDISPIDGDPEATITKMDAVIAAALAPAKPSNQDRSVAAQAQSIRAKAVAEAAEKSREELAEATRQGDTDGANGGAKNESGNIEIKGENNAEGFGEKADANNFAVSAYQAANENGKKQTGNILNFIS